MQGTSCLGYSRDNHLCAFTLLKDQFHKMVELTMAARQAYKTTLENMRQELAGEPRSQSPPSPATQGPSAPTGEEPHYSECSGNVWCRVEHPGSCLSTLTRVLGRAAWYQCYKTLCSGVWKAWPRPTAVGQSVQAIACGMSII